MRRAGAPRDDPGTGRIDLAALLEDAHEQQRSPVVVTGWGRRSSGASRDNASVLVDTFAECGARCCFLRVRAPANAERTVEIQGSFSVEQCRGGGWLLRAGRDDGPDYWIPVAPVVRRLDPDLRILSEDTPDVAALTISPGKVTLSVALTEAQALDVVVWLFPLRARADLEDLLRIETQRYFLWGSHTAYARPADLYLHLIHGAVYENKFAWPHKRKICSENDAHALYVVLSGLERATGKRLYALLKRQILLSVMARQSPEGGFRHGEWTDRMETHFQFVSSAMHLFADALAEEDDPALREALGRLAAYASRQHDTLDAGTWFLHDDLELSEEGMNECPFTWTKSRAFGKSETNMLVLPSHLDATIALDRFREATGDERYRGLVESARSATRAVLASRPAEWLYRALFRAIGLTLLPGERAAALPLPVRALKRLAWRHLIPRLHRVKTRFPRLVMPGGYVDRAVPLAGLAFHYLPINIYDLARYRRRFPDPDLGAVIDGAVRMTKTSGVLERWGELNYEKYAIGFWAESLYQLCVDSPEQTLRAWLAEAIMLLEDLRLGVPPSLLGASVEAVSVPHQRPCPSPIDGRVRIANLSSARGVEFLAVNASGEPAALELEGAGAALVPAWRDPAGRLLDAARPVIPARSWAVAAA
jgi:hypothetical protein